MSNQITDAFVQQFSANVFHLSQQKESRLKALVRNETQVGKAAFWDRIGSVTAQKKTTRHGDTPQIDTPHSRRRVTLSEYEHADLIDEADRHKLLQDPSGHYAVAFSRALGRAIDDEIIAALGGSAFGGEDGSTTVALPSSQKLISVNAAATDDANLNVQALRRTQRKLDEAEVDESEPRHFVYSASQRESLLAQTEVTSSDFNVVKTLVMGQVNTFLGFNFVRSQRLPRLTADITTALFSSGAVTGGAGTVTATTSRRNYAWAEDGMMLSTAMDMKVRIGERADKSYSDQVFAALSCGSTRLEEEKVVEVICNES